MYYNITDINYYLSYRDRFITQTLPCLLDAELGKRVWYYRFQINCTFLPKSEIFYTADVKNLGVRYKISL